MRGLVEGARVARLATVAPDGRPHVVPIVFALATEGEGATVYSAVDQKPKTTRELARLRNIETHPQVALLVDHYADDWSDLWWVRLRGSARVVREGDERDRALDLLAAKYPQYEAARPDGPVIVLEVDEWQGWSAAH